MITPVVLGKAIFTTRLLGPALPHRRAAQLLALAWWGLGFAGEAAQAARIAPDAVAVDDEQRGPVTYTELVERAGRTAIALHGRGATPGSRGRAACPQSCGRARGDDRGKHARCGPRAVQHRAVRPTTGAGGSAAGSDTARPRQRVHADRPGVAALGESAGRVRADGGGGRRCRPAAPLAGPRERDA